MLDLALAERATGGGREQAVVGCFTCRPHGGMALVHGGTAWRAYAIFVHGMAAGMTFVVCSIDGDNWRERVRDL